MALLMALRLNELGLLQMTYESITADSIEMVVQQLPQIYVDKLLRFIAILLDPSAVSDTGDVIIARVTRSPHI